MVEAFIQQPSDELHDRCMTRAKAVAERRAKGEEEETTVLDYGAESYALGYKRGLEEAFEYAVSHRDNLSYNDFINEMKL